MNQDHTRMILVRGALLRLTKAVETLGRGHSRGKTASVWP